MQLTQEMYGTEFHPSGDDTFGFRCGQMRHNGQLTHNSGWYNGLGQKLGFGDLSDDDVLRILCDIEPDEIFLVLSENDSFWRFGERDLELNMNAPGVDYVVEHAFIAITSKGVYFIGQNRLSEGGTTVTLGGLGEVPAIKRTELREMVEQHSSSQKV